MLGYEENNNKLDIMHKKSDFGLLDQNLIWEKDNN